MNHDLLNDEHLSIVNGGTLGVGSCSKGNGNGGSVGLGGLRWLYSIVRSIAHAFDF
ncbi:MAG: hypothetical protein ACREEK_25185 [Bradyrhizobium sp.]